MSAFPSTNARCARRCRRAARVAFMLAAAFAVANPAPALASRPGTDVVLGKTVAERSIDASEMPDIVAAQAIVVDPDGTAYFERDADKHVKIASITKVMTAIVALENAELDSTVTVDHAAATVGEATANLQEGDTMTLEAALHGLLISSGNDAALAIASSVGKLIDPDSSDPTATFVDAMNKKAAELGCKDTKFTNPHGLDIDAWKADMYSTARDVATMFAHAMKNETFRKVIASDADPITVTTADGGTRRAEQTSHNHILGKEGNIGGKTGTTGDAGQCFVGAFSRKDGGDVYVVELGSTSDDQRFADTLALATWYYGHVAAVPFAKSPASQGGVPILARATFADWSDKTVGVTLEKPEQTARVFSLAGAITQDVQLDRLSGNIEQGRAAGTITYTQAGKQVGKAALVTAESKAAPNPIEWIMVQFDRVVRFFTGKPGEAASIVLNEAPDPLAYDSWDAA